MRNDDASTALDRDDFDGDEGEIFGLDGASAGEPLDRFDDPDAEPDDELLEAELGAHDIALDDEIDDDLEDEFDEMDDDDREITLLQELGIDLDARDDSSDTIEALALDDDASGDDEVAA